MEKSKLNLKKIKIVLLAFIIIVFIIIVYTACWVFNSLNKISDQNNVFIPVMTPESFYPTIAEPASESLPKIKDQDIVIPEPSIESLVETKEDNIEVFLIYGLDSRTPRLDGSRSDVIMFIAVDWNTGTINLASVQRDTLVEIPGKGINRINAAFSWGGLELALKTMKHNFYIEPDHVIVINFQGVVKAIDLIGGVEIDVQKNEISVMRGYGSDISSSGMQTLDGLSCLAYSRNRYVGGVFERTQRHRNVITSILNKKSEIELSNIIDIINIIPDYFYIDMNEIELIQLLTKLLSLDINNINQISIPAEDTYRYGSYKGMSILYIDLEENIKILHEHLKKEDN